MRFLGSKFTQNALAWTTLGELKRSPGPLADFRGPLRGRGKGKEGKEGGGKRGKGVLGKEKREGREGKRGGRERGRRMEREGRGSLRYWR